MRADAARNRDKIVEAARAAFRARGYDAPLDDIAKAAVAQLKSQGIDVNGKNWKKAVVKVTPGGK